MIAVCCKIAYIYKPSLQFLLAEESSFTLLISNNNLTLQAAVTDLRNFVRIIFSIVVYFKHWRSQKFWLGRG